MYLFVIMGVHNSMVLYAYIFGYFHSNTVDGREGDVSLRGPPSCEGRTYVPEI